LTRDDKAIGHKQRGMRQGIGIFTLIHWNVGQRSNWGIPNEQIAKFTFLLCVLFDIWGSCGSAVI